MEKLNKKQKREGSSYQIILVSFIAEINYLFPEKSNTVDSIHPAESFHKAQYKKALFQVE